jgi:sigma-B regulation protein RsbU (phosphoserine phosphatase)
MRLTTRLILLVGLAASLGVIAIAVILTTLSWRAIHAEAQARGAVIAQLIGRGVETSERVVTEVEALLDQEAMAQAVLIGHLADQTPPARLAPLLAEIAARGTLAEIWLTDPQGGVRATSVPDPDPDTLARSLGLAPARLTPLLDGTRHTGVIGAGGQTLGGPPMRYVGARGAPILGASTADAPTSGAIVVGREQRDLRALADAQGVPALLRTLTRERALDAVLTLDAQGQLIASSRDASPPSAAETTLIRAALDGNGATARLLGEVISVAAPLPDAYGLPAGATLIRLSAEPIHALLRDNLRLGGLAALSTLAAAALGAIWVGRRVAAPVLLLAEAARAVEAGAFTPAALARPAERADELGALARRFIRMAEQVRARREALEEEVARRTAELRERNDQLERARARLATDLDLARRMQATILPNEFAPFGGWTGAALMTPALEMAGDFHDHFALDADRLGLVIADVSGKGVAPAFFMAMARAAMREAARRHGDPGRALTEANDRLRADNPLDLFVTMFYAVIDRRDGSVFYANGGHNQPYVVAPDGATRALPLTDGMMLGLMEGLDYDSARLTLASGETLFLFTDGVTEAMNAEHEEFGEARLETALTATAGQPVEAVLERVVAAVRAFARGAEQSDDITCLIARYNG